MSNHEAPALTDNLSLAVFIADEDANAEIRYLDDPELTWLSVEDAAVFYDVDEDFFWGLSTHNNG